MKNVVLGLMMVFLAAAFVSCSMFFNDPIGEEEGVLRLELPIDAGYPVDEVNYYARSGDSIGAEGMLNIASGSATADVVLPAGDWTVGGYIHKEWDNETGFCYDMPIAEQDVTVNGKEESTVTFENPLSDDNTVSFTAEADASTYIGELGVNSSDELVGVFINSADGGDVHYHFHAEDGDGDSIFNGTFNRLLPGEYHVEYVASNYNHPDWVGPWEWEIAASYWETINVASDTDHSMELFYEVHNDFSAESEDFTRYAPNGTIDLSDKDNDDNNWLYMKAEPDGCHYDFVANLGTPKIYAFDYYASDVDTSDPKLHVNLLSDGEAGDRLLVTFDDSSIDVHTYVDEVEEEFLSFNSSGLSNTTEYRITIYLAEGWVHVWIDGDYTNDPPDYSYDYPSILPEEGMFGLETHNEVYIDDLLIRNDIHGNVVVE
jgi:hypothetical protein